MARFPSKIDPLFGVLFAVPVVVPGIALAAIAQEGLHPLMMVPAVIPAIVVAMTLRTHYDITDDQLIVRCGLLQRRVALPSIRRLRATRTLTAEGSRTDDRSGKWALLAVAIMPVGLLVVVGVALFAPRAAPMVTLTPTSLVIGGSGGASVLLSDIESASLEDTLPTLRKSSGFNSYAALRGRFVNPQLGEGRVWVRRNDPPYILARTRDGFLLLNLNDPGSTRAMYGELAKRLREK